MISQYKLLAVMIVAALSGCQGDENTTLESGNDNIYVPIVKGEVTLPSLHVGTTARGTYEYFDPNVQPRKEATSLYVWRDQYLDEVSKEREIKLDYEHLGNSLSFCVTPIAQGEKNTIGQETCSKEVEVKEPLADKPTAVDVVINGNATITVGDTLEGGYSYLHVDNFKEGATELRWKADGAEITGKSSALIELTAAETEGKKIAFCVTPITAVTDNNPAIKGDEVCSDITEEVVPLVGGAPVVKDVNIDGKANVHAELIGTYQYTDTEGDLESNSQYIWKRDTIEIADQTKKTYKVTSDDLNKKISFCVTPKSATGLPNSGSETCFSMSDKITVATEVPPIANKVMITVDGIATVGKKLNGSFEYSQEDNAIEGNSDIQWYRGDSLINQCKKNESDCLTHTITDADLTDEDIKFCAKPKTLLGTSALDYKCSSVVQASGLKLSGTLEYNAVITATGFGDFKNLSDIEWRINTHTQDGPLGDTDPDSRTPILEANGASAYRIGVVGSATSDYDWDHSKPIDARNFIGKQLEVCIDSYCLNASDANVTGGMYVDDTVVRTIEPVRMVTIHDTADSNIALKYHRPLTVAESNNQKYGSTPVVSEYIELNGIQWALPKHENKEVLNICRNLHNGNSWFVPQTQFSGKYILNVYENENKPTPDYNGTMTKAKATIINLTKTFISNNNNPTYLNSPVFGWPIGPVKNDTETGDIVMGYVGATYANKQQNFNVVRFYSNGGTANNGKPTEGAFVSCVSE